MGKPGGFFKRLKTKQKKEASKRRRGTKGASKEDRARKRDEQAEYYAAKREAEELAKISSSSDDEDSTDSEAEASREEKKLLRLRQLLGVRPSSSNSTTGRKRGRGDMAQSSASDDEHAADAPFSEDEDDEEEKVGKSNQMNGSKASRRRGAPHHDVHADELSEDAEEDDWRAFIGDEATGNGSGASNDEDEEEGFLIDEDASVEMDEADRLPESLPSTSDDEEEEAEGLHDEEAGDGDDAAVNPLYMLDEEEELGLEGERDSEADDAADDLFDAFMEDGDAVDSDVLDEDDEEEDEEDKEDVYVDEEEEEESTVMGSGRSPSKKNHREGARLAEDQRAFRLPSFELGSSGLETLVQAGVVDKSDPWFRKYHLDLHGDVDATALHVVPLPASVEEALAHSNDALVTRSQAIIEEENANPPQRSADRATKDVFFVSPADYALVKPSNITVAASEHARQHFLHSPFNIPSTTTTKTAEPAWCARPPFVHEVMWEKWCAFRAAANKPVFTYEERGLFDLLQGYSDAMDCVRCWQNGESRREIFVLHMLNHWFKARAVVAAHDQMIQSYRSRRGRTGKGKSKKETAATRARRVDSSSGAAATPNQHDDVNTDAGDIFEKEDFELRDRGFGKTRLFVMLPMRNMAYQYVGTIVRLLGADPAQCPKLGLFESDFTEIEEAMDPTFKRRPKDYRRQFDGNIDDAFCVGFRLEPSRVHVYTHPLNSDLIICSPLGLRRRLEKSGDISVSLASVEVCVVDEAHVLYEQNWQHVTAVLSLLNKRPTDTTRGLSDLRRVYAWALEGKSGRHRQTVMSSNITNPAMFSAFRTSSVNSSGKLLLQHREEEGAVSRVLVPVRQHFFRFEPASLQSVDDDRFTFFTEKIYATKINPLAERDVRTIIVVPSYFDFVRLRNYMFREYRETFAAVSEYSTLKQQRRALGQFTDLERPVLLLTERFYFFKRYFVKLGEGMVFYSPPLFPEFYASLVNRLVATSPHAFALTVYCRYDTHELNRVAGTRRLKQLLERESGIFSFVTS